MREIEIKIRVNNIHALERKLSELGCILSAPIRQYDTVYSHKGDMSIWEGMKEGYVVVRIRRDDVGAIFTLKQQKTNELDNIECETRIENGDAMHQALLLLGFIPEVEVKKVRRKGKFDEYEICLDQVEGLGDFVEIERMVDDGANAGQIGEELYKEAEILGLSRGDEEKRGYDTQLYQLQKKT